VIPVVDGAARLRGMLNRATVVEAVRNNGGGRPVLEVMAADVRTGPVTVDLEAAVTALQQSRAGAVGVVDAAGKLAGYVTADSIREAVAIGQGRAKGPLRAAG
jgi:CBS domain-containing protein